MPKKVKVIEPEPQEVKCEITEMPEEGEPMVKIEPHNPAKDTADIGVKKVRKPLSQESLDKLAVARQMAYKKRLELKAGKEDVKKIDRADKKAEKKAIKIQAKYPDLKIEPNLVKEKEEEEELVIPDIPPKVIKNKPKSKKPIVVVEDETDSSDDGEQVIYIKKRSGKKKEPVITEHSDPAEEPKVASFQAPQIGYKQPTNPMHQRYGYNPFFNTFKNREGNR